MSEIARYRWHREECLAKKSRLATYLSICLQAHKDLPFSALIKDKIKAYLTKMVEDKEILAELISEA